MNNKLTTIILTYNEELNIQRCIDSVKNISREIIVIDSFSEDNTESIVKSNDVKFIQRKFDSYSSQFNYALNYFEIKTPWILRLDADEELSQQGQLELCELCNKYENDHDVNGFVLKFNVHFLSRELKYGGVSPIKNLRVFKKNYGHIEERIMDEHIYLTKGKAVEMKSITMHNDKKSLHKWIDKHNNYANLEVKQYFLSLNGSTESKDLELNARVKRIIKYKIYYKLPMFFRSTTYFIYRYIFKLGFIDGKEGLIFTFFQAYWYRMLVDAKILEIKKEEDRNENYNL